MTAGLDLLFRDTFATLGIPVTLMQNGHASSIRMLLRQPESWAVSGDLLSARIEGEIAIQDVPAIHVGDAVVLNGRRYKIFQEPLKDPSGTVWLVQGMIAEGL